MKKDPSFAEEIFGLSEFFIEEHENRVNERRNM